MSAAIGSALEELAIENKLRVVVITDVGRAFCAGADHKEIAGGAGRLAEDRDQTRRWRSKPASGSSNRATISAPT
jgi:enoyl-CoA hydratase/carnithine racemase